MSWGPFEVSGKNVVITGGAMGIGFGIAQRFVEGGANVLLVDLDEAALRRAQDQLSRGPGKVATLRSDIGEDGAGERAVAMCTQKFGGVDVLVNNAGIYPQVPMMKMDPAMFDKVYRVNLKALAFFCKAAAQQMLQQGRGGRIINVGSVDSLHPSMVGLAAYDASKGGVLMFTRNFALEMAPHGITVNVILPGGVSTEGTKHPLEGSGMTPEQQKAFMEKFAKTKIPLGRMAEPDEIAGAAVFLASNASRYMTGAHLVVDGGLLLT